MNHHPALSAGNVAVITGAADGIGLATAKRFAQFGMNLVMADINGELLDSAASEVRDIASQHGGEVGTHTLDVAQLSDLTALKDRVFARFGRVNVLMNNAGTYLPTHSWEEIEQWRHLVEINLWGILHGVHAFTQAMIDQDEAALIINTGSKQGITNPPGNPAYNVSKAAVKSATESLQHELRNTENCQVSAHLLVPGFTFTGLTKKHLKEKPAGAWEPEQVADYMIEALNRGSFYIICPDNDASSPEDARRIMWGAGDISNDRPALSRWDPAYQDEFKDFKLTQ
ncbi:MAG: SDR family NAD(P)-dependent oxidoreductase [Porticoccaceae bacterium]